MHSWRNVKSILGTSEANVQVKAPRKLVWQQKPHESYRQFVDFKRSLPIESVNFLLGSPPVLGARFTDEKQQHRDLDKAEVPCSQEHIAGCCHLASGSKYRCHFG